MKTCKNCKKQEKTNQIVMDVTHKIFNQEILVKGVPIIECECGYKEYAHPEKLDFQIRDAYRSGTNVIDFKI